MLCSFVLHCSFACNAPAQATKGQEKGKGKGQGQGKSNAAVVPVPARYSMLTVDDAGTKPPLIRGLHIATKWKKELDAQALNNPDITSITLYGWWMDMNPSKGVYDWSRLDAELNRYVKAGKNCGLMIAGGQRCPEWIFSEGVRHFTIVEFKHGGKGKEFTHEQPVVYDRAYIDYFSQFVRAMAAHMKTQSYWNKVTHVSITGVNRTTAELRLPAQENMEVDGVTSTDAIALWKNVGYDPETVLATFKEITNMVATAFPNRYLIVPVINNTASAFPAIGSISVPTEAMKWLKATYPTRAAAQYTALTPDFTLTGFVKTIKDMGIPVGYELNESKNRLNEDENFFTNAVQKGVANKALYIEIFPENAKLFKNATTKLAPEVGDY